MPFRHWNNLLYNSKPFVTQMSKYKHSSTKWQTMGGTFKTKRKARVEFKLPEFSQNKTITYMAHIDKTTDTAMSQYDMIIRTNLMVELKLKIDYTTCKIHWDDVTIPMKQRGTVSDLEMTQMTYKMSKESSMLKMSEEQNNKIIKAMYGKIDIKDIKTPNNRSTTSSSTSLGSVSRHV